MDFFNTLLNVVGKTAAVLWQGLTNIPEVMREYPVPTVILLVTAGSICLYELAHVYPLDFRVGLGSWLKTVKPKRGKLKMTAKARREFVRSLICDGIVDHMENLYFKEKITLDERNFWYDQIGNLGLRDLLPKRDQKTLKEQLKEKHGDKITEKKPRTPSLKNMFAT